MLLAAGLASQTPAQHPGPHSDSAPAWLTSSVSELPPPPPPAAHLPALPAHSSLPITKGMPPVAISDSLGAAASSSAGPLWAAGEHLKCHTLLLTEWPQQQSQRQQLEADGSGTIAGGATAKNDAEPTSWASRFLEDVGAPGGGMTGTLLSAAAAEGRVRRDPVDGRYWECSESGPLREVELRPGLNR